MKYVLIIFTAAVIFSCTKTNSSGNNNTSNCIQAVIDSSLAKPKGTLYTRIDQFQYNGAIVYLCYAGCCDRFNDLKDANCVYLFSPSGGITGCGDCTHPNFFNEAKFIKTMWQETRP